MLDAGVALPDALHAYLKQPKGHSLRTVVSVVAQRVSNGANFSAALAEFPTVFPTLMRSLIQASEASGQMGLMLIRISEYLTKERRTARQITGALTYPAVMISLALVVTGFLMTWVLPRFAKIYESRSAALPRPTQFVLAIGNTMTDYWPWILAGLGVIVAALVALAYHPKGKRFYDGVRLNAPIVGPMFRQSSLARACRTMGTLLASGVTMLDAVRIVRTLTVNVYWDDLWRRVEDALTAGQTLSEIITQSKLIPPQVGQMIAAGERTGRLAEVLDRIANATENDLDETVKKATQLIEPAMIMFMGVTIGGIAIALLLPIFTVANVMAK